MSFLKWMSVFVVAIGACVSFASECVQPSLPKIFDGTSVSAEDVRNTQKAVSEFRDKSQVYMDCLKEAFQKAEAEYAPPLEEVNAIEPEVESLTSKVSELGERLKKDESLRKEYNAEYAKYQKAKEKYNAAYNKYGKLYEQYEKKLNAYNDEAARVNKFLEDFEAQLKIYEEASGDR